ncbi:MAG: outer membrane lipoprotein-sorting protein [Lentisphaeria bacterium]|nr:outer membrane lipoprotein-sorting protein [Candidatus Neomarinimicrobiota bacterium]MCF7841515.1 outer membrane lipoprotein-sorting protein [Lentisphaeria bacterium]
MRHSRYWILFPLVTSIVLAETGLEIMEKLDAQPAPENMNAVVTMTLENKRGQQRIRTIQRYQKEYTDGEFENKSLIFFLEPADERGTGFLQWNYREAGKDDDQWLYLPALGREKRIAAAEKNSEFMGTDFTYEDMGDRDISKYTYKLLGEETLAGEACWKIEGQAKDKSRTYQRMLSWISKEKIQPLRVDFFDKRDDQIKVLEMSDYEQINGFWIAKTMHMQNLKKKHQTTLAIQEIDLKKVLNDDLFTIRMLKRGVR